MSEMQTLRWICDERRKQWLRAIRTGESEWTIRQKKKLYYKALEKALKKKNDTRQSIQRHRGD